jgi:hypothetical protein
MSDLFDSPQPTKPQIERDGKDRPRVMLPDGKRATYARCTTYVGCLEDQYRLQLWQQRMVAIGLADRPDLLVSVAAHRNDREALDGLVVHAREAARATAAARTGTALHALAEQHDRGEPVSAPPAYAPDIAAYVEATRHLESVMIEQFCVNDRLKVAGTFDRLVRYVDPDGKAGHYIADIKTGSIDFGHLKHAMQFAMYANSTPYDIPTHERFAYPDDTSLTKAILIHLPQGEGRCDLYWVNISDGWEAVKIATAVRAWRNRKGLVVPFSDGGPPSTKQMAVRENLGNIPVINMIIRAQSTPNGVREVYREAVAGGMDGELIVKECKRRIETLESKP